MKAVLLLAASLVPGGDTSDLQWRSLHVQVSSPHAPPTTILDDVSGRAEKGRLLAILGPSGSGKTTLLNCLAGQLRKGSPGQRFELTGEITSDGKALDDLRDKEKPAYVKQEDLFFPFLTARETLRLMARLRLPRNLDTPAKNAAAENVLRELGLSKCAETVVGDVNGPGLSGGERKRLNLACELIGGGELILADEPSSGLDSFQALQVMEVLHRLCRDLNKTVVASIHQPRSSIWSLFDDVLVLSEGQVLFHGPAERALPYFKEQGFPCPAQYNPAEFLIDLAAIDRTSKDKEQTCKERIDKLAKAWRTSPPAYAALPREQSSPLVRRRGRGEGRRKTPASSNLVPKCSVPEQFALLLSRAWRQTVRDSLANLLRATISVALAVLFGLIFGRLGKGQKAIEDRMALLMHSVINTGMIAMVKALNVFARERHVVQHERSKSSYGAAPYLLSKILSELPVELTFPLLFGSILHVIVGLNAEPVSKLYGFLGVLGLHTLASSSFGMMLSSIAPTTETALAIGPALMVVFILLGGIQQNHQMPSWLKPLEQVSLVKWAFQALAINEFTGLRFIPEVSRRMGVIPQPPAINGEMVLERMDLADWPLRKPILVQSSLTMANYLITYLALLLSKPQFVAIGAPQDNNVPSSSESNANSADSEEGPVKGGAAGSGLAFHTKGGWRNGKKVRLRGPSSHHTHPYPHAMQTNRGKAAGRPKA
ncbi:unnamed protein product [Vitrella brassicaformis CCMP3155]|uniref:ABC transporter domain-containing protein n=2 Tax=Vitrella brassicaformis TaxID=1169539 RepID=A0A0G4FXC5_VITBC|nr:unnamed protein product [Vitrella brassicaformis CCMP3155]|eukprot:CEM19507.1 unnamed protein product [Vitrella brassicaformis CCMP3155]